MRLRMNVPQESEAMAVVPGTFNVSGTIRVYVNADYASRYPSNLAQEFRIIVRLQGQAGWSFDRELRASAVKPAFSLVGQLDFEVSELEMAAGESVRMTLVLARWSESPQQGREDWPETVMAEVSALSMCATQLQSPTPPPSPPSPPPCASGQHCTSCSCLKKHSSGGSPVAT